MRYVQRGSDNKIIATFANEQPGFAEEFLEDDDPELLAFVPAAPTAVSTEDQVLYDHENRIRGLEGEPPLTMDKFAELKK